MARVHPAGNVTIGGKASATAGPIGIGAGVDTALINPAPMFTYSKSRGLFAGVSLEGTVLIERKDANEAFVSLDCHETPGIWS